MFVTIRAGTYRRGIFERDGQREQGPWLKKSYFRGHVVSRRADGWKLLYALRVTLPEGPPEPAPPVDD